MSAFKQKLACLRLHSCLFEGVRDDFGHVLSWYDCHTVAVTDHEVTRKDCQSVDTDRHIPFVYRDPPPRIGWTGAAGEDRKPVQFVDLRDIAGQPVDQCAARTSPDAYNRHGQGDDHA